MIPYKIKIDLEGQRDISSNITLSVGDVDAYGLVLEFYRDGRLFDITGYNLAVNAMPAGATLPIPDIGTVKDGRGYYVIKSSMYAYAGETQLEIILSNSGGSTVTKVLRFPVRSGFGSYGGSIADEKDYTVLNTLIQRTQAALADAMAVVGLNGEITLPISVGDGTDSLLMAGAKMALADASIAIGPGCVVGRKAYYIGGIDRVNKKIYLSNTQVIPPAFKAVESEPFDITIDTSFEAPAYAAGDEFSIICNTVYSFADKIASIENNVITWSGDFLPSTPYKGEVDSDSFTFHVPSKPNVGVIELGINAFAVGQDNKSNGRGAFVSGGNNIVSGDYGAVTGKNNKGGHGVLVSGIGNIVSGNNSFGTGSNNILSARYSGVIGQNNTVKAKRRSDVVSKSYGTFVAGISNTVDGGVNFIAGLENTVKGHGILTIGSKNISKGDLNTNIGSNNTVSCTNNTVIGTSLINNDSGGYQTTLGAFNSPINNAILIVGNGADDDNRTNALIIEKSSNKAIFKGTVKTPTLSAKEAEVSGEITAKKFITTEGGGNTLSGTCANAIGAKNTVTGDYSEAVGYENTLTGRHLRVVGFNNNISGSMNYVLGQSLKIEEGTHEQIVLGKSNIPDSNARLIVGNGSGEKTNAMVIKKSGKTIFSGSVQAASFIDADGNEYVSKKYVDEQIAALKKQLGLA